MTERLPLPEHVFAYHSGPKVSYILERARRILPGYGLRRAATDAEISTLLDRAGVWVRPLVIQTTAFLTPPLPHRDGTSKHRLFLRHDLGRELRRLALLHELGHALGGHFGPEYNDAGRDIHGKDYAVWEKEADLFAAYGLLSITERRQAMAQVFELLLHRVPLEQLRCGGADDTDIDGWVRIRAPWIARQLSHEAL